MRIIDSSLLHLAGAAFLGDPFVHDGFAQLRWSLDQRLGLPRTPFVIERRPSVALYAGRKSLKESHIDVRKMKREVRSGDQLNRLVRISALPGGERLLRFRMSAPSMKGGVCFVRLSFAASAQRNPVELLAERDDRGESIVVDRLAGRNTRLRFELKATRIDSIRIRHPDPLLRITILTLADLDEADWGSRMEVPITTRTHVTRPIAVAAGGVIGGYQGPRLQHPLDGMPGADPASLPAISVPERQARYVTPWVDRLEPLVDRLFSETEQAPPGERYPLHQTEIVESAAVSEFGSLGGAPQQGATAVDMPVALALAAAAAGDFHLARLLGLAFVPEQKVDMSPGVWDYRLLGRWEYGELEALIGKLQRRMVRALDALANGGLDAAEAQDMAGEVARLDAELRLTSELLQTWTANGSEALEVVAFAVGIKAVAQPRHAPPAGITIRTQAPNIPGDATADADLAWQARPRYRSGDGAGGSYAAVLVRDDASGSAFINTPGFDPALRRIRQPFVPDDLAPRLADHAMPINQLVGYSLSECDAFGRWSAYAKQTARVDHRVPPEAVPCEAALLELPAQPGLVAAKIRFRWDIGASWDGGRVSGLPANMSFRIHLRRDPPPTDLPQANAAWGRFEATAGSGAPAFSLRAQVAPGQAQHDGIAVSILPPVDSVESLGARTRTLRTYELVFSGIALPDQADGRKRAWFSVSCVHDTEGASPDVGQPALSEYVPRTPPPLPGLPPDPLFATWADADNRSFVRLAWNQPAATPRATWFQILSCGEAELLAAASQRQLDAGQAALRTQALATFNSATASLAQRAAALRTLAVFAEAAFRIEREMIPAEAGDAMSVMLTLPGSITTLSIYTVRPFSSLGNASGWPAGADGFAVVKVPQAAYPTRPVILRAEPQGAQVALMIAEPAQRSVPVGAYELYRTTDPAAARAGDYRRLRLLSRVPVVASSWQDWEWFEDDLVRVPGPGNTTVLEVRRRSVCKLVDPTPPANATAYYMVVAVADGATGERARSPASPPYTLQR